MDLAAGRVAGQAHEEQKRRRRELWDGSVENLLHRGVMGVLTGLTRTLSWVIWQQRKTFVSHLARRRWNVLAQLWALGWLLATHLLERVGIKQDPSKLNHLGRVLCHIDAVLVAGGRNVDDDVAIDV